MDSLFLWYSSIMLKRSYPSSSLSLQSKITYLVLLMSLCSIWVLTLFISKRLEQEMTAQIEAQQFSIASYIADSIENQVKLRISSLTSVASLIAPELMANSGKVKEYLHGNPLLLALFQKGVVVISKEGRVIADYPVVPGRSGVSLADREYFRDVVSSGKPAVGKPTIGRFSGKPVVGFATPILDRSGKLMGVMAGYTLLSDPTLLGTIESSLYKDFPDRLLVGSRKYHMYVTGSDPSRAFEPRPAHGVNPLLDRLEAGFEGSGITVNSRGVRILVSGKQIPTAGWFIRVGLPAEMAFAPIRSMKRWAYSIAFGLSLLSSFLVWLIIRQSLRPLYTASRLIQDITDERLPLQNIPVAKYDEIGQLLASFNVHLDYRKKAEELLVESEERFKMLYEYSPEGILLADVESKRFYSGNKEMCEMLGYSQEEICGLGVSDIHPDKDLPYVMSQFERRLSGEYTLSVDIPVKRKNGSVFYADVNSFVMTLSGKKYLVNSFRDITERRKADEKIFRLNRLYTVLSKINEAIVRTHNLEELYEKVCKIVVEDGQFRMAWMGIVDKDTALVKPAAKYGYSSDYLDSITISVDPNEPEGVGPTGNALREGRYIINNDTENNPAMLPWRDEALKRGYLSNAAFPLFENEKLFGAITLYANEPFYFNKEEIELLLSLSNDVSFAIEAIVTEEERRKTEETLKKREENFRQFIDSNPVAMAVTDKSGKFRFFNNKFMETFGYTMDDIPTLDEWWQRAYPDEEYRQKVMNSWRTAANKAIKDRKHRVPQEWRVSCRDGSLRNIEFRMSSMQDFNIYIFHDITESRHSREQLETANELLENIIEFLPDATLIIDKDKRIIAWNRAIEEITGVPKKDIVGKDHYYAAVPFYGEPRPFLIDLVGKDDEELASKYAYVKKKRDVLYAEAFAPELNNGGGAYIWTTASPLFDTSGKMIGAIESIRDISHKKSFEDTLSASEEKYRTLFEESKDAVFMSSPEGKYLDINQAGVELFGYSSKEEFLAIANANDLYFNPEDRKTYLTMVDEQGFVKDYEIRMKRRDGKKLSILSTSSIVRDEQGAIKAYRGIMRDVTEHKNLEQQLLQSQKMEAIGQLAGGIAHDFNNLLTAIIGYSDLELMALPEDTVAAKNIKVIRDAGEKAASLVKQILSFSRKQVLEMSILNLNAIAEDMGKLLTRTIGENISLDLNIKTKTENIMADSGQVGQILLNLAVNARDAMPSGGRLSIGTSDEYLDEDFTKTHQGAVIGKYVLLTVTDTGHGISKKIQDRIFEPFFTTKEPGKGTGLGLSTVYGIVKQHNGYIWVYSEEGEGSTFKIYLPAVKGETTEAEKPKSIIASGTETVLVVDDEPDIRRFVVDVLQSLGYKVIKASSAREALRISNEIEDNIDLLLTDLTMPGMNGLELRESFLKKSPATKVIVMSGYGDEAITDKRIKKDDIIFMQKPLTYRKLATKLRDVLDTR